MKYRFNLHNHVGKNGKSLLYLYVTMRSPQQKIPLDIYIEPRFWDKINNRVLLTCPDHGDLNLQIEQINAKITSIKLKFRLSETIMTIDKFVEEFNHGIPRIDFIEYFHFAKEKDYAVGNIKFNTWKKEKSVHKALKEFKPKLTFADLTIDVLNKFCKWRSDNGIADTSINSNLAIIKKYITRAIEDDGILMPLKVKQIKVGSTDGHRESLTKKELKKFIGYYESDYIRDNHIVPLGRFLFSCFTGMRIGDNQEISSANFYEGKLMFESEKSNKMQKIQLTKPARKILKRCPEMFTTKLTDQHINRKLQEAAKLLGIRTHVTFHISRHTFATNFLDSGGSIETLNKILAHSSIETTMVYVHVNKKRQNKEMKKMDKFLN